MEDAKKESLLAALDNREPVGSVPNVQVTRHIYANETSYVVQRREVARQFRQIAGAMR